MASLHSISKNLFFILIFLNTLSSMAGMGGSMSSGKQFNMTLLAGVNQGNGNIDGVGGDARFDNANFIAINSSGHLFVTDSTTVRKVVVSGTTGTVTTFAGGETGGNNGNGVYAQFGYLSGIVIDGSDNIYVACDYYCEAIRKIDTSANVTDLYTGGPSNPSSLARSSSGIFYTMFDCAIYKVTSAGVVTFFAGQSGNCGGVNGVSTTAQFGGQIKLYYHNPTSELFVVDSDNSAIRKINASGTVTTFSGLIGDPNTINGASATARFDYPKGITYDSSLSSFFVTDSYAIRKMTTSGTVSTFAGSLGNDERRIADGTSATALFGSLDDIVSNGSGTLYVTDADNSVRKIDSSGNTTTIAGVASGAYSTVNGTGSAARIANVESITKDSSGNLYILESPWSSNIRKVTPKGVVTTYGDASCWTQDGRMVFHSNGNLYFNCYNNNVIYKMTASGTVTLFTGTGISGNTDGVSTTAQFYSISNMKEASDGSIYVTDYCAVRKVTTSGTVSTVAGVPDTCGQTKGAIGSAQFEALSDLVIDTSGNIFASELNKGVINKITSSTVTIFAGNYNQEGFANGTGTAAQFSTATEFMTIDPKNNIYLMDNGNHAIRKITSTGVVTTPIGRKMGAVVFQKGLQLGPLPTSINYNTKIIYDRNKLYLVSPGGIFIAPAN